MLLFYLGLSPFMTLDIERIFFGTNAMREDWNWQVISDHRRWPSYLYPSRIPQPPFNFLSLLLNSQLWPTTASVHSICTVSGDSWFQQNSISFCSSKTVEPTQWTYSFSNGKLLFSTRTERTVIKPLWDSGTAKLIEVWTCMSFVHWKNFQLITFYANNPTIKIRMAKLSKAIRKQNFNNHHHQLIIKWLSTTKGWSNLKIFVSRKIYINSVKCCRTAPQNREPLVRKRGKSGLRSWMYNTQKKNPGARFFPGKHL